MIFLELALMAAITVASWLMATSICNRWKF
jgi:hypothetical protein